MASITARTRFAALAVGTLSVAAALTGCASSDTEAAGTEATESTGGYPVTVETYYGDITLDEKPERIVALGADFVEALISVDEEPETFTVAGRGGDDPFSDFPWLDGLVDESRLDLTLNEGYAPVLEAIAAYEPDLILGYAGEWSIGEEMYEQISAIAPTYTNPDETETAWQTQLHDVGALVGKSDEADQAVADFEVELAEAQDALAGLQGATVVTADSSEASTFTIYGGDTLLPGLGLVFDEELIGEEGYRDISIENLDELTSDVLFFRVFRADSLGAEGVGRAELEADPRFATLPGVVNGAVIFGDAALTNAAQSSTLGYSWYLDQIVPVLEKSALNAAG